MNISLKHIGLGINMNMTDEEMQDYFPTTFPKMFVGQYGGIAVGKGWFNILRVLCQSIQWHLDWSIKNNKWDLEYNQMITEHLAGDSAKLDKYCGTGTWAEERRAEILEQGLKEPRPIVQQVVIEQVKEKFGSLRFYYQGGDEYISGLVSMAESMAGITCETCGDAGEGRNGGWIRTLCDKHEAEYQAKRKEND